MWDLCRADLGQEGTSGPGSELKAGPGAGAGTPLEVPGAGAGTPLEVSGAGAGTPLPSSHRTSQDCWAAWLPGSLGHRRCLPDRRETTGLEWRLAW